jgi:hypothetical protein
VVVTRRNRRVGLRCGFGVRGNRVSILGWLRGIGNVGRNRSIVSLLKAGRGAL